jgi:hypothetical protein
MRSGSTAMMSSEDYSELCLLRRRIEYLRLRNSYGYKKYPSRREEVDSAYADILNFGFRL